MEWAMTNENTRSTGSHVLTWAIPTEARSAIPDRYRRVFSTGKLEIYAHEPTRTDGSAPTVPRLDEITDAH